jgi:hypothetical protein
MRTQRYPTKQADLVLWARHHANVWKGQSTVPDIGVSQQMADNFDAAVTAVEGLLAAQGAALSASKAATQAKDDGFVEMLRQLGSIVTTIDGYARNTDDPQVWVRAQIDAPKSGSERPAPPTPTVLPTQITTDGSVVFSFEVTSGGAALYEVQRQVLGLDGSESPWGIVAIIGEKRFTDPAVPVGVRAVDYRVRARISNGAASAFSTSARANFGSAGSQGGPMARVA